MGLKGPVETLCPCQTRSWGLGRLRRVSEVWARGFRLPTVRSLASEPRRAVKNPLAPAEEQEHQVLQQNEVGWIGDARTWLATTGPWAAVATAVSPSLLAPQFQPRRLKPKQYILIQPVDSPVPAEIGGG